MPDAPVCPICEVEMTLQVVTAGLGGAVIRNTPYYFCPNVDECATAKPADEEYYRKHYLYCWNTGTKEIEYGTL